MTNLRNHHAALIALFLLLVFDVASARSVDDGFGGPPCSCASDDNRFDEAGNCPSCDVPLVALASFRNLNAAAANPDRRTRNVAIVVYEGVELLDFAGPGEVFKAAFMHGVRGQTAPFNVYTVAPTEDPILSQGFLTVQPEYTIETCPTPDILVIPGGAIGRLIKSEPFMAWVDDILPELEIAMSVCNGVIVIGKSGLLDGKAATTHHGSLNTLRSSFPDVEVQEHVRYVDNGQIITTAGVSAGIDGALHIVARLCGDELARSTAQYLEYRWEPQIFLESEDGAAVRAKVEAFRGAIAGSDESLATLGGLLHENFVFSGVRVDDPTQLATTDRAGYLEHFGHHEPGHYPRSGVETVDVNGRLARARLWFTHDRHTMHVSLTMLKIGDDWRVMSKNFYTERTPETAADASP